jgi:hypothetical protein
MSIFYRTERAGAIRLSDGGGPFGFDITVALIVDYLLLAYSCEAIVETGCFLGDTTSYLTRRYPDLSIYACDIDPAHAAFTRRRLTGHANVTVTCGDSPELVASTAALYQRPMLFLDAHWDHAWPLRRELAAITTGIVIIHDFDVGHPRFAFDTYEGVVCGPGIFAGMPAPPARYFTPDPDAEHSLPCLQIGRRAGVGIVAVGMDPEPLESHPHLIGRDTPAAETASVPR